MSDCICKDVNEEDGGWFGVDLDGTLAFHEKEWRGPTYIGAPIPAMVERVKRWLAKGKNVRVFTARMSDPTTRVEVAYAIAVWTQKHIGQPLPATCIKDYKMIELWDDRAVTVEFNTGRRLASRR